MSPLPNESAKGGICVIAGEASGDAQAALLVNELIPILQKAIFLDPAVKPRDDTPYTVNFWGVAGPLLRNAGVEPIISTENLAVMGFREVLKNYLTISESYKKLLFEIEKRKPSLIIVVDYPGFNLRFAEDATRLGFKVVYYIPPKVWSHGLSRIEKLKKYTVLLLSILPFEVEFFKRHGLNAVFVGNPLFDEVNRYLASRGHVSHRGLTTEARELDPAVEPRDDKREPRDDKRKSRDDNADRYIIGILPGSRKFEIIRMLPDMIAAFILLEKEFPNIIGKIPVAQTLSLAFVKEIFEKTCKKLGADSKKLSKKILFLEGQTYNVMYEAHYAWVCSGTATLETAFFQTPLCAVYKINAVTAFFAKMLLKVKYISLVNLCMNKEVIPEFLKKSNMVNNLVSHAKEMLTNSAKRELLISELAALCNLFPKNAALHAAQTIAPFVKGD